MNNEIKRTFKEAVVAKFDIIIAFTGGLRRILKS